MTRGSISYVWGFEPVYNAVPKRSQGLTGTVWVWWQIEGCTVFRSRRLLGRVCFESEIYQATCYLHT